MVLEQLLLVFYNNFVFSNLAKTPILPDKANKLK